MARLTEIVKDQDLVWQGFSSCTSFHALIEDKLNQYKQSPVEKNSDFKSGLLALEINNLVSTFNEQIVSWIIAIDKWYKDKSKTLLYYLCSVSTAEVNSFIDKYIARYKKEKNDFLQSYTYNLKDEIKNKTLGEIDYCFELLFTTTFFKDDEASKRLITEGIKQIHNKTRHAYVLLNSTKLGSLFVPEGYGTKGVKVLDNDTSEVLPVVVVNNISLLQTYLYVIQHTANLFQLIIGIYSFNRFGNDGTIKETMLEEVRTKTSQSGFQFVTNMFEALKKFLLKAS
ncbi:MAG: hypothetical protein HY094_00995 [Candidatus Melainabacteria bacterium]|nr:hypothetical protein [Candidatus Melainabacteria bacterium]